MNAQITYKQRGPVESLVANLPIEAAASTLAGIAGGAMLAVGDYLWGAAAVTASAVLLVDCARRLLVERSAIMAVILHMSAAIGPQSEIKIEEQ